MSMIVTEAGSTGLPTGLRSRFGSDRTDTLDLTQTDLVAPPALTPSATTGGLAWDDAVGVPAVLGALLGQLRPGVAGTGEPGGRKHLLDIVPQAARTELRKSATRRRYRRGQTVYQQGDAADALFIADYGRFGVVAATSAGDIVTGEVYLTGDHFGEVGLVPGGSRTTTVVALEDAMTIAIPLAMIERARRQFPEVAAFLTERMAARVGALHEALAEVAFLPIEQRVWRRLNSLLADTAERQPSVGLTQEWLASMAGTTRPSVNRLLRRAEKEGWLALRRGQIRVLDRSALQRAAEGLLYEFVEATVQVVA